MSCERKLEILAISKSTMACYLAGSLIHHGATSEEALTKVGITL